MLFHKEINKNQLNTKLNSIKEDLSQLLSNKISVSKGQSKNHLSLIVKCQQTKYSKRSQIEKENNVLIYELKLLSNFIERLEIDQESGIFKLNEDLCNAQIKLNEEIRVRGSRIQKLELQNEKIGQEKLEISLKLENEIKKVGILQKKLSQYEKLGGITRFNQFKDQIKQVMSKNDQLERQKCLATQQLRKQKQKCAILQQLNRQTEQKLSEAMVIMNNDHDKENNSQNFSLKQQKNVGKVELLAAKQEIRALKLKIESLERAKSSQKQRHEVKQTIYQKLVMKNMRN